MTVLKAGVWPWLIVAAVLIAVGLFAVKGGAGSLILACGFLALFGAGVRAVTSNDTRPRDDRRPPAGHSGV
jgi:hypothetical protein